MADDALIAKLRLEAHAALDEMMDDILRARGRLDCQYRVYITGSNIQPSALNKYRERIAPKHTTTTPVILPK